MWGEGTYPCEEAFVFPLLDRGVRCEIIEIVQGQTLILSVELDSALFYVLNICVDVIANGEETLGSVRLQFRNHGTGRSIASLILWYIVPTTRTFLRLVWTTGIISRRWISKNSWYENKYETCAHIELIDCWLQMTCQATYVADKIQARGARAIELVLKKASP
jgi:hypothetical protein